MLDEMDEMELLASVNPEPDVTGNPWDGEVLALEPVPSRRRRWPVWAGAAAACVALLAGGLALRPDDRVDTIVAGDGEPKEPVDLAEIPWNDPIELRFEPGKTSEKIVVPHPGTVLFEMPAELQQRGEVLLCGGFEAPPDGRLASFEADPELPLRPGMFRCSGDSRLGDSAGQGVFVASVFDEEIRVLYRDSGSPAYAVIGSLVVGDGDASDREPSLELRGGDYPAWTRNDAVVALTGAGFDPGERVTIARCLQVGYAGIDHRRTCESAAATIADEAGGIDVDADVPATTLGEGAEGDGLVDLFAFQGDQLTHRIEFRRNLGPYLLPLPTGGGRETDVEVRVIGLRPGEVGRIDVCPGPEVMAVEGQPPCAFDVVREYTVVGTGSDELMVTVPVGGFARIGLSLTVNDVPVGGTSVFRAPRSAEQLPPGTLDVSPASVSGSEYHTFTITGRGWTEEGPVFILMCNGTFIGDCDAGTRVTPVDGAFTVEVPFGVSDQGLVIKATNAAQTQVGSFRVDVR